MANLLFTHNFERYRKNFVLQIEKCHCGGRFNVVNLHHSNRNILEVQCERCKEAVLAFKKNDEPAFDGAPLPIL